MYSVFSYFLFFFLSFFSTHLPDPEKNTQNVRTCRSTKIFLRDFNLLCRGKVQVVVLLLFSHEVGESVSQFADPNWVSGRRKQHHEHQFILTVRNVGECVEKQKSSQ